ncbi:MAG: hypothetical protein WAN66_20070 [Limnoraphis robusta]|uniref:Uncharacterized protein n=2 Tax=Limnoraphis robusta TaxID=1118279 RepID=A0A0F5YGL7_9CYAN|nr:hypothetical protein [Limnoraphis robusta]KKD37792.1 hypothetical protein WN50_12415 [Limnoraphis robusta CS-951]MEA5497769.1 hypothetical protein [Limnoraphis robusta BA-68 BA1]MEA5520534.1 hypothetical protein [Limnoraphis robusta CCNP1315]MEA5542787.1 hypothetical protein [Limnoraphis robusta Tam1]MEA5547582.1 hypothetical protein [Limnoraphis robusta CCNP1324]
MRWLSQNQSNPTLTQLLDHILTSGQLDRSEYLKLMSVILSDSQITDAQRNEINRIFDYVQTGRFTLIDF